MVAAFVLIVTIPGLLPHVAIADSEESHDNSPSSLSLRFWSINRYATSTTDFEEVDDARKFTSEALFSESTSRLNRPLTRDELKNIVRTKEPKETFNNLRLSVGALAESQTDIDLFYKYKDIDDAQITDFFNPNEFNSVSIEEYGIAVQHWFASNRVFLRGSCKRTERRGIIEFLPQSDEDINSYEINAAFRLFGGYPNSRFTLYPSYVFQDINQKIANPSTREREISSIGFSYGNERKVGFNSDPRFEFSLERILERRF